MVKRFIKFFNSKQGPIGEAALVLGIFSLLSQILGLIRDRMLVNSIGSGPILDVYYAAFRIPDFLYISVASLASVTVLLPFLVDRIDDKNNDKARIFLNSIFTVYMVFMLIASIVIAILMPYIAPLVAPGFNNEQLVLLIKISRIMLLSPIFIGLSNMLGTVTQLFRNFFVFSLSPVFYNLGILFGVVYLYPKLGVTGLAFGVVIGALLHLSIQIPVIISHGFFPLFTSKISWTEIYKVVRTSFPRTVALSCTSLVFIVLISLASLLVPGSISLFTFSYNLQSVPVGIIGISYSVAAFPVLVKSFSNKDMDAFVKQIVSTARSIIFWSLPIIALLAVLRAQIVRVVLGSQRFSWSDTRLTAAAVALFIVSLVTQSLVLLLVRSYYASGNTKKPLLISVFSSIMIIIFAFLFLFIFENYPYILSNLESLLRVQHVSGTKLLALPLAYSIGSFLNFILLWIYFKKDFLPYHSSELFQSFLQSTVASIVMGTTSYVMLGILDNILDINTGYGILLQGLFSGLIGIGLGVIVLALMKNKELFDLIDTLSHKFWRSRVIAPEQKEL